MGAAQQFDAEKGPLAGYQTKLSPEPKTPIERSGAGRAPHRPGTRFTGDEAADARPGGR